ncbi:diacylglycerol kinase [Desulfitispora alkaliphila]|uniref:diacylglycerol kinase family protein n=1 Tax=Desulfitispora alkaliphila TaxID=622674 RepID=UPI003D1EF58C
MRVAKSFRDSFSYAIAGIFHSVKTERNMKIHLVSAVLALATGWILRLNHQEMATLILAISFVIVTELINTAVERTVDLCVGTEFHPLAKQAKNVAAGAVLVASVCAVFVGIFLFLPNLIALLV